MNYGVKISGDTLHIVMNNAAASLLSFCIILHFGNHALTLSFILLVSETLHMHTNIQTFC